VTYQAGAHCGDLDAATQSQNRAVVCGSCYSLGAGFLSHGGFGALSRLHGLAIDSLISVDLVTADGTLVTANATSNSDLFWAVRGALPNFGVAVAFTVQTFDVSTYYGGVVRFLASSLPQVGEWVRNHADDPNLHARTILGFSAPVAGGRLLTLEIAVWGDRSREEKAEYLSGLLGLPGFLSSVLGTRTYFDQQISTKPTIDATRPGMKGFSRAGSNELGSDEFFTTYYQQFLTISSSPYGSGTCMSHLPTDSSRQ
jgi:FAD/FMN-containing dehydrogenase